MINILKRFFSFCHKDNRKKFYKSIILGFIKAIFEAMKIPAIALMLSGVLDGNVTSFHILGSLGIMLLSVSGNAIISYFSVMLQTEGGYKTCADKRIEIAEHLKYLPMGYFNKNNLGYITSVATNTMEALADIATRVVMLVTQGILTTTFVLIMVCIFDIRIGLVSIAGIIFYYIANSFLQKQGKIMAPLKDNAESRLVSKILEYLHGISEVRSYNLTGEKSKELNDAINQSSKVSTDIEVKFIPIMFLQNIIIKLMGTLITFLSILFYLRGTMDLLNAIVMIIASFILFTALDTAGNYSALIRSVDHAVTKAQGILDLPEMDTKGKDIMPKNHNITLENIDFSYENRKIIDNISLHIPEKTRTAIVGPSGSGKTTLCHLISRFWDVNKGCIKLGDIDVREYSMDSLMKNFSFVFQNVYLFNDTVANNIRFGQAEADLEKVIEAAKKASCHDFIMNLPMGYDTIIGEGGASLSGGEKQRLSIARAIMKDAPIIILDEATANVDPENEDKLVAAINELTKEKTIIMIAHRLKTVRNANKIIVIDNGKIAEEGSHEELMKNNGIYKTFIQAREKAIGWKI